MTACLDFGFKAAGGQPGPEWSQMMSQLSVWKKQANISNSAISNEPLHIETPEATDTAASCNVLNHLVQDEWPDYPLL